MTTQTVTPAPITSETPSVDPPVQVDPPSSDPPPAEKTETVTTPFAVTDIKLPEGVKLDESLATPFVELVNKHSLPREAVDAIVALQVKSMQANSEASSREWDDLQKRWSDELAADPELGGAAWAKHEPAIGQMLDKFGSPEVRAALDLTGAGNNPHIVRMFAKLAAAVTEPGFVPAPAPVDAKSSVESRLFPTMT